MSLSPSLSLLDVWFMGQQHQHHLGVSQECGISGPTPRLPESKSACWKTLQVMCMHRKVWEVLDPKRSQISAPLWTILFGVPKDNLDLWVLVFKYKNSTQRHSSQTRPAWGDHKAMSRKSQFPGEWARFGGPRVTPESSAPLAPSHQYRLPRQLRLYTQDAHPPLSKCSGSVFSQSSREYVMAFKLLAEKLEENWSFATWKNAPKNEVMGE